MKVHVSGHNSVTLSYQDTAPPPWRVAVFLVIPYRTVKHLCIMLLALACGMPSVASTQRADSLQLITVPTPHFECGESGITPLAPALRQIGARADSLMSLSELRKVNVRTNASAEGSSRLNAELAEARAQAIVSWLGSHTVVPARLMSASWRVSTWQDVDSLIRADNLLSPYRAPVLQVIRRGGTHDEIQATLRGINGGEAWKWLVDKVLPLQRSAVVDLVADKVFSTTLSPDSEPRTVVTDHPQVEEEAPCPEPVSVPSAAGWVRHLYLKTNIPAWAMLWSNIAVELDLAPHWSFTLPVYYSGLNYFTGHTKFRTLAFQPEFRWWPRKDNAGFFAGAHFGLGWYNVAFGGEYRYQDHLRHTPAVGGGLAAGYRFHFCRNRRWQMEASLGFGVYRLDYDMFQNHADGLLVGRRQRTFYGIDQATFTISYRFDLGKKKGGER